MSVAKMSAHSDGPHKKDQNGFKSLDHAGRQGVNRKKKRGIHDVCEHCFFDVQRCMPALDEFLKPFSASSQLIHGQRQKRMHGLAERKKYQKQIGEKNMQYQHKGMAGIGDFNRQVRSEVQKPGQVFPV